MLVAEAVGRALATRAAPNTLFGLIGSGNFAVTNAVVAGGVKFVAARHEGGAWDRARGVAGRALGGYVMSTVGGATHFHVASLGAI